MQDQFLLYELASLQNLKNRLLTSSHKVAYIKLDTSRKVDTALMWTVKYNIACDVIVQLHNVHCVVICMFWTA